MAVPATSQVRNIVLVGQDGAGKTSFAEAMLHLSGRTTRLGTTSDGKSNLDYDPEEIKRGFTIASTLAPIAYQGFKINLLDTSGSDDFIGETIACLGTAELAFFVVDAVAGAQVNTIKLWEMADRQGICRAFFINHIDREHADYELAMKGLSDQFGPRLGAVTIPMGVDKDFKGVIDVIRMQARYRDGAKERIEAIPAEFEAQAQAGRDKLVDLVAEADDELMMKYLEGEELTQAELESLVGKAIAAEIFIPVYVGSALIEAGIEVIMDDIISFFPDPTVHRAFSTKAGEAYPIDPAAEAAFYVFKTVSDAFVGRLSFVKVLAGSVEVGMEFTNAASKKKERIAHIYEMTGKESEDIKGAPAGDIVVIPKLAEAKTGDSFSLSGKTELEPLALPQPLYPVAIEAASKNDEDKLGDFLSRTADMDPCIRLHRDDQTRQTILTTLGEGAVDLILSRLKERTGIEAKLLEVKVPYRETIRRTAEAQGRHKKQTGGAGQFGDCWVRLEPNPSGGYEFLDEVVGGRIPRGLIPAVDKGIKEAMVEGFLTDDPFVDLKAAVYDGSYHSVDSNEMAFKQAGRLAFRNACEKADVYILEPMANIEVTVTEEYAGTIMGDFSTRRGRVAGMGAAENGRQVIKARVPYKEVVTYAKDLRSMTRGVGTFSLEVDGYEEVPGDIAKKLIADYQAKREEK